MAIRNIITLENDLLRKKSKVVTDFDKKLCDFLDDMKETLQSHNGAGLAAVQVGILRRIFVVEVAGAYLEFINPVIVRKVGSLSDMEGCLSIPDRSEMVTRPQKVTAKAQNRYGEKFEITLENYSARAVCHEYDHLEGVLYIDYLKK